jgi:hypothetical protein
MPMEKNVDKNICEKNVDKKILKGDFFWNKIK